jgi:membrane protease YdiL (CAAX protease family)
MASFIKKNIAPFLWFAVWIFLLPFVFPSFSTQINVYANLIYYVGLLLLVLLGQRRLFSKDEIMSLKKGKTWLAVLFTILGLILAFALSAALMKLFPNANTGWGHLKCNDAFSLATFAISTIIMPPLAEELFFRKSLIILDQSKKMLLITAFSSIVLFGLEHSLSMPGFVEGALIGIALSFSYIRTKNIIVPVTAHFIANLLVNGSGVISAAAALLK